MHKIIKHEKIFIILLKSQKAVKLKNIKPVSLKDYAEQMKTDAS